ncbi:MAG: PHP domain-containing protein [Chloroflexota bacterium]
MKNIAFDLHIHSTASDGTNTPEEIIQIAKSSNLLAIAITDHDSINGYFEAFDSAQETSVQLIAGVELNTDAYDTEIDILGYFWKPDNQKFLDLLDTRQSGRIARAKNIVEKLNSLGLEISFKRVREIAHGSICRPHIVEAMVEKNYVANQQEAFEKYLGLGRPAFVPHDHLTPEMAIQSINEAGGVSVVAHPGLVGNDEVVEKLMQAGAKGLEAYYPMHSEAEISKYLELAQKHGVIVTCGSDSHGAKRKKSFPIGSTKAPMEVMKIFEYKLKEVHDSNQGKSK